MAYKIKHHQRIPKGYFQKRELQELRRDEQKHFSIPELAETGARQGLHFQEQIHKKGTWVNYKGHMAQVVGVSKEGIHLVELEYANRGIAQPSKPFFVPEHRVEHDVTPFNPRGFPIMAGVGFINF